MTIIGHLTKHMGLNLLGFNNLTLVTAKSVLARFASHKNYLYCFHRFNP